MESNVISILLIDDDEDDFLITRDLLSEVEGQTYDLEWLSDYEAAREAIEGAQHDVCLVDYRLGQHDGLELIREVLANGSKMPIILLTGQGDRQVDVEAMRAGAGDYLVKGQIDPVLLERSIRYCMERKRVENERAELEEQLLQSQKLESVGRLAGGIAHDFNNLMTPIVGYTQMCLRSLSPDSREYAFLEDIHKAAGRATNLIQQLLAFSRRQIVQLQVVDMNDILVNVDMMLRRLIGEDIELIMLPAPDLGLVEVDPTQIEQVLVNLAINARDAMANGGTLIIETINVTFDEHHTNRHSDMLPGEYVMLAISDTGIGMTEDVITHIFEPFFTTKERGKGTGLGLSTCYGIVAQNRGHIWVYSEPNEGTTFKIYFPMVGGAPSPIHRQDESGFLPRGNETVLLVEDEVLVRELAVRVLRQQGYHVLEAPNGVEALQVARAHADQEIHLLLTDVVMPLIGGKELSDKLKDLHPETKVLFTSGYTDEAIVRHGVLEPETHFIQKPYSLTHLTQKVREVLDESKDMVSLNEGQGGARR